MNPLFDDIFHTKIKPVENKFLWSVIIPTRNCANFLKTTIQSILCQYPGSEKMEIIVVDDCSDKDNPQEIVDTFGEGKVKFIKQETNVGKSINYGTGLNLSSGKYIHILHGDDLVLPGFYSEMEYLFSSYPTIGAAFCQTNYINEKGEIKGKTGIEIPETGILDDFLNKIVF
ncbi:MAG: glycosyltransferase family 2 protein [Bacteroidales bacterium]|nr:glycosyltransferase family 2 protein [Bacteroidales bacterium]